MNRCTTWPIIIFCTLAAQAHGDATTREHQIEVLVSAQQAYDRASDLRTSRPSEAKRLYQESASGFQSLVHSGVRNGRLFYNLGNACMQTGQLGQAILNYRRALRLMPGDPQVLHNLDAARAQQRTPIAISNERVALRTLLSWHYDIPGRTRFAIGVAFYLMFWVLLALRWILPNIRWSFGAVPCALLWLVLGTSVAAEQLGTRQLAGVLVTDEVIVRKGNGDGFSPQFEEPLFQGVEFVVVEDRGPWWHIELPDGQRGWVRRQEAELI
jgi:tetratricopeptide (TPR) repeat protein